MTSITIGQIWLWFFNKIGAIPLDVAIWSFNLLSAPFFIKYGDNKFWRVFGWFNLITGILYLLLRFIETL